MTFNFRLTHLVAALAIALPLAANANVILDGYKAQAKQENAAFKDFTVPANCLVRLATPTRQKTKANMPKPTKRLTRWHPASTPNAFLIWPKLKSGSSAIATMRWAAPAPLRKRVTS